jgi:ABC-type uncharacterized transport system substrate-binding protein
MRRQEFFTLIGATALMWSPIVHAQQPQSAPPKRIGVLFASVCPSPLFPRLADLGWIGGRNCVVDCVSTDGRAGQLSTLVRELVLRRPDVLVAVYNGHVQALMRETTTIPIVMGTTPDPVRTGLVSNLARPEANVTGVAWFGFDILPKRIELLKEIVPDLKRLAIITTIRDPKLLGVIEDNATIAVRAYGFSWQRFRPVVANDYDEIFARIAAEHFDAAYVQPDVLSNQPQNAMHIIELALLHRVPTVHDNSRWAKNGLLLSYGPDLSWSWARVAEYVDKILRGAKPANLPVEQPTKLELVINLKTAKALNLFVPPALIARADEVVE